MDHWNTRPCFQPAEATLMDFRVDQQHGTTFVYVKPFLKQGTGWIHIVYWTTAGWCCLWCRPQTVHQRFSQHTILFHCGNKTGIIPMTNHRFPVSDGRIINIGTAGDKHEHPVVILSVLFKAFAKIVEELIYSGKPFTGTNQTGRPVHDSVLLYILKNNKVPSERVFSLLFKKINPACAGVPG